MTDSTTNISASDDRNAGQALEVNRREFIKASGIVGTGLVIGVSQAGCSSLGAPPTPNNEADVLQPNAWLEITSDNRIIFTLDRVEMGQGTFTGLGTLVAEELDVEPESIEMVFASVDNVYNNNVYGLQMTGGSTSIVSSWKILRQAGAAARQMLIEAASERWDVDDDDIETENGFCLHRKSNRKASYGDLASLASEQRVPRKYDLKKRENFKYIGKHNKRLDTPAKVFGAADYGIDVELPNMHFAVLSRCPVYGGKAISYNEDVVRALSGVVEVLSVPNGIAIVAKSYWQARKAQGQLKVRWDEGDLRGFSSEKGMNFYKRRAESDKGQVIRKEGSGNNDFDEADSIIEAEFEFPYLAHATMEPQNCTAVVSDTHCEVWAPTQAPDVAQIVAIQETGLSHGDVKINTTYLGGGFGRRLTQDFVAEAVSIARVVDYPVKLVWSREEDTQHDLYRPAFYHKMRAAIEDGELTGWDHTTVGPRLMVWYAKSASAAILPNGSPKPLINFLNNFASKRYENYHGIYESLLMLPEDESPYEGAKDLPYDIDDIQLNYVYADPGIPVTFWRSVGHSHNAFVIETFIDEIASKLNQDSYRFRRELLDDEERHRAVLDKVAQISGWDKRSEETFKGIACHKSFGSYVAQVVELEANGANFEIKKVYCVVDCGTVVNPDVVHMQMESGIIYGLTAALYGEITFSHGAVQQSNFHDYQPLRMNETPEIEVVIMPSEENPTGVGEPGLPPIAPALANALFQATKKRQRKLPLDLSV